MNEAQSHAARVLAKNTLFNLVTQVGLVIISFLAFPILVNHLTTEGFGLLSLVWVLVGYFSLLDFGVSRAITKFVAEFLARKDDGRIRDITWTSLSIGLALGCTLGLALLLGRGLLLTGVFHASGILREEASISVTAAAVGIPFMLAQGILRGVQTAYQRFDLVNGFQAATGLFQWVGSVVIVLAGGGVKEVVLLTVMTRVVVFAASLAILPLMIPGVFRSVRLWDLTLAKTLLSFGGWVSLSQFTGPLFIYVDRLMIASFMALSAVAYYTVPQEAVNRMLILPLSMTTALYPVMSAWSSDLRESRAAKGMYRRSVKYVSVVMFPLAALCFLFAKEILRLWMGPEFAAQGALPLQIFLVGLMFNAIAQIPVTLLHAYGRPDLPAKFNLIELPVMIGLNVVLIPAFGIAGAASAWAVRVILDCVLLFRAGSAYAGGIGLRPSLPRRWTSGLLLAAGASAFVAFMVLVDNELLRIAWAAVFTCVYASGVWLFGFDDADRGFVLQMKMKLLG